MNENGIPPTPNDSDNSIREDIAVPSNSPPISSFATTPIEIAKSVTSAIDLAEEDLKAKELREAAVQKGMVDKEAKEEVQDTTYQEPQKQITLDMEVISTLNEAMKQTAATVWSLRETAESFKEVFDKIPRLDYTKGKESRYWLSNLRAAIELLDKNDVFLNRVDDTETDWRQSVEVDGVKLKISRDVIADSTSADRAQRLVGDNAISKIVNKLNLGTRVTIPLWHTGIWVTLQSASDLEHMALEDRIANEKITLGMITGGVIFSNSSVYLTNHVLNHIFDHIIECSLKDWTIESLRNIIRMTDIPSMVWGMACTMYPGGYQLHQPCIAAHGQCQYVHESLVNVGRMHLVDNRAVTPTMAKHMYRSLNHKVTEEDVMKYQQDIPCATNRTVTLKDSLKMVMRVPSISTYVTSGSTWIQGIVEIIDVQFKSKLTEKERDDMITRRASVSSMRQCAHWIEQFVETPDNPESGQTVISDTETIESLLVNINNSSEIREIYFNEVSKFIDDSTFALIGIPRYDCPQCHKPMAEEYKKHPRWLPMDAMKLFFTLLTQRTSQGQATGDRG